MTETTEANEVWNFETQPRTGELQEWARENYPATMRLIDQRGGRATVAEIADAFGPSADDVIIYLLLLGLALSHASPVKLRETAAVTGRLERLQPDTTWPQTSLDVWPVKTMRDLATGLAKLCDADSDAAASSVIVMADFPDICLRVKELDGAGAISGVLVMEELGRGTGDLLDYDEYRKVLQQRRSEDHEVTDETTAN